MLTNSAFEILAAPRMENVNYAIRDLVVIAEQIAREGKEILYLNIGDPPLYGFQPPPRLIEAVHKAMRDGINGYGNSLGLDAAVESIRCQAGGKGFENIQGIFVTMGSGEAVDCCLTALVNPGDNVLTPCPDYPLYSATLAKNSCRLNSYRLKEEEGWEPDLDDIAARINSRTRGIVLINPNNPTGAMYSRRTLEGIAEIARRHNLIIFSDEIYDKLILDPTETHVSMAAVAPDVPVVTFNGLSKAYCCPGWRIGWGIATGPQESLKPFLEGVYKLLRARLSAPHALQYAIKPALDGPQDHLLEMNRKLRRRRDLLQRWCEQTPGISCVPPKAAFYAYPKLDIPEDDITFVRELLEQTQVLVVHGAGFGDKSGAAHCRIVFLPEEAVLTQAFARISAFMRARYC
ncbi:MAG: aminotransferase class I/II-fold pyridoxal phosphate-dependent enzyme [Candidatus Korobacteraceae bacterium]